MKLKILALIFIIPAVASYSKQLDTKFIDKVGGLQEVARIAQEGVEFQRPKISPDGRWIAFTSVSPNYAVWIASIDDPKPELLAKAGNKIRSYNWSPDSQEIVYVDGSVVRLINVKSKDENSYNTGSPFISDPVFDTAGNLAFVANTDLIGNSATLEVDLEKLKAVKPKEIPSLEVVSSNRKKRFVDDEARLAGENIGVPYIISPSGQVYLKMNGEDKRITPVESSRAVPPCLYAILSPDRQKLTLQCTGRGSNLSVYEIVSKRTHDLGVVGFRSWSPDSEWVLCREEISDGHAVFWNDLYITHYTGGKRVKVARAKGIAYGASWAKDDLIAYDEEGKIVIAKIVLK